jgi:defect-in-organelle-trafficking protein DotD
MKTKLALVITSVFALSACTPPPPPPSTQTATDVSLAEASYSVSKSIVNLAEVAQASHPLPALDPQPNPASYGMAQLTSVDWSGPVEPLIKQLANASNYRMRVLGAQPGIPVLVTLNSKNTMLADVLRDVGYQCGRRATVLIYPDSRVIELRYAKN